LLNTALTTRIIEITSVYQCVTCCRLTKAQGREFGNAVIRKIRAIERKTVGVDTYCKCRKKLKLDIEITK